MKRISFFFLITLIIPAYIFPQWSNNPNQNLQISDFGYWVTACEDGMGGAFVGWTTANTDYPSSWLQWVDKYGYVRWSQPLHIVGNGETQAGLKLINAETGKVIILFTDGIQVGWDSLVWQPIFHPYLRTNKIDTTGFLFWGERGITVTEDTAVTYGIYSAVEDEDNGIYITWKNLYPPYYTGSEDSAVIRVQKISNQGERLWGETGKYICTRYGDNFPEVYINRRKPDGIFLKYFKQNYDNTLESINPDMSVRWSKVNQWYGDIIPDNNGGGLWARTKWSDNFDPYILAVNRINEEGNFIWNDSSIVIDRYLDHPLSLQDYKILNDSSLVVVWQKKREDNQLVINTYLQILDKNGIPEFSDSNYSIKDTNYNVVGGNIILSDSTNFIIIWIEGISNESKYLAQKFNRNVEKLWNSNDIVYSLMTHESRSIISDGNDGFIDAFGKYYPEPLGVFIQQVSRDGNLGEIITSIDKNEINNNLNFNLFQNYPNPFNPTTKIKFTIPAVETHRDASLLTTLKVFDILGNEVASLVNETKPAGTYEVEFNAVGLASGIYFYQLKAGSFISTKKLLLLK